MPMHFWRIFQKHKGGWLLLVLAGLTLALFAPAIRYSAISLDDPQYVFDNPHVTTGLQWSNVRWAFTRVHESWWLPALWISYMVDASLFGTSPGVFHAVNVLLHAANAAILFWVLRRGTGNGWASAFAAALFAFHPLRVESVAWITERKDVLSGLFWMLAMAAHLRQANHPSNLRMALVVALMALGLMAKASVITLPLALLLMDFWPLRRLQAPRGWKQCLLEKLPLFALSAAVGILTVTTHGRSGGLYSPLGIWERISLIPGNYFPYLAKMVWPAGLSIYYVEHDAVQWPQFLAGAFVLLLATWVAWRARRRAPFLLMGWLWFLIVLFPVIRGVRTGIADYANRFTYLPSIGFSILVTWGFSTWLSNRPRGRMVSGMLAMATLAACGILTAHNLRFWRNSDAIFERAWTLDPDNYLGITGHGLALQKQERWDEALAFFQNAAAAQPHAVRYRLHQALALINMNRGPEAVALLEQGLDQMPKEPEFLYALGVAFLAADQPATARTYLARAVATAPKVPMRYRLELARACFEENDSAAAAEQLRQAETVPGNQTFGYADLLGPYASIWNSGERPRALQYFRKLVAREPDGIANLNNVAWLLATSPCSPAPPEEAIELALHALKQAGDESPVLLDTLAAAYANGTQYELATATAEKARRLAMAQDRKGLVRRLDRRIAAYRQGNPWREKPLF